MAKTKEQLVAEAQELGIELTGEEKVSEIQEAIKITKEELGKTDQDPKAKSKEIYFYHLKTKCYKDETNRVEQGVYRTESKVERFDKVGVDYAERFDGEIPTHELHKIAEQYKVSVYEKGGKKVRDEEEILADLLKEL